MTEISRKQPSETEDPHWIEWATGIFSAVLVVGMIGWVGVEAVVEEDQPPEFGIAITGGNAIAGGYRVEFEIANRATRTAAAVVVRGEILDQGKAVEDAEVTFDYVPAQSKSSGAMLFSAEPGQREVRIRAVGYSDP